MMYARIENDKVVEETNKPTIKHVSSAHLLSDSKLKEHGYLPVDVKEPSRGGQVVDYSYEVLKTKVNKVPVEKVDERPITEPWETAVKDKLVDHGDWLEQTYTVDSMTLSEFKEQKKRSLISTFSMSAGSEYNHTIQLLVLFGALDNATIKEVEGYYKVEGKKLGGALKAVDAASSLAAVRDVEMV